MPTQVVNIYDGDKYDVYIGRPSKWGNPFPMRNNSPLERTRVIELYDAYIRSRPELLVALPELLDKRLGCFCHPLACHGDVLIALLEESQRGI